MVPEEQGDRRPLIAILTYWVLLGSWVNLAGQYFLFHLPLRLAFIMQARSVINCVLTGILVELIILITEVVRGRSGPRSQPARLGLHSLISLVLLTAIVLPMLYVSTRNVKNMREVMLNDLAASGSRDVQAIRAR
jgi:hypothetical protein